MIRVAPASIALALSAAAAVGVPLLALRPQSTSFPAPPPLDPTPLARPSAAGLQAPLGRALFSPAAPSAELPPSSQIDTPPPTLVGVIAAASDRGVALFRPADGQTIMVRVGASVDGWRLISLRPGRARLARGAERVEVRLDFSNKARAGTAQSEGGQPTMGSSGGGALPAQVAE